MQNPPPQDPNAEISLEEYEKKIAKEMGVPLSLVHAVRGQESSNKQVNEKGQTVLGPKTRKTGERARGRFQLMPDTAKELGVNPDDDFGNTWGGIKYLRQGYDEAKNRGIATEGERWALALTRYHGGSESLKGAVNRGGEIRGDDQHKKTSRYVDDIMEEAQRITNQWRAERGEAGATPTPTPEAAATPEAAEQPQQPPLAKGPRGKQNVFLRQPKVDPNASPYEALFGNKPVMGAEAAPTPAKAGPYPKADLSRGRREQQAKTAQMMGAFAPPKPPGQQVKGPEAYETKLDPKQEAGFKQWMADQYKAGTIPLGDYKHYLQNGYGFDYDYRAAYKAGVKPDPKTGHWSDIGKKPSHETFSDQSAYAKVPGAQPGHWQGTKYIPPAQPQQPEPDALSTLLGPADQGWRKYARKPGEVVEPETPEERNIRVTQMGGQKPTKWAVPERGTGVLHEVEPASHAMDNIIAGGLMTVPGLEKSYQSMVDVVAGLDRRPGTPDWAISQKAKSEKRAQEQQAEIAIQEANDPSTTGDITRAFGQGFATYGETYPISLLSKVPASIANAAFMASQQDWRNHPVKGLIATGAGMAAPWAGSWAANKLTPTLKGIESPALKEASKYLVAGGASGGAVGAQELATGAYDIAQGEATPRQVAKRAMVATIGNMPFGIQHAHQMDLTARATGHPGRGGPARPGVGDFIHPLDPNRPGGPGALRGEATDLSRMSHAELQAEIDATRLNQIPPKDLAELRAEIKRRGSAFTNYLKQQPAQQGPAQPAPVYGAKTPQFSTLPDPYLGKMTNEEFFRFTEGTDTSKLTPEQATKFAMETKRRMDTGDYGEFLSDKVEQRRLQGEEKTTRETRTKGVQANPFLADRVRTLEQKGTIKLTPAQFELLKKNAPDLLHPSIVEVERAGRKKDGAATITLLDKEQIRNWRLGKKLGGEAEAAPAAPAKTGRSVQEIEQDIADVEDRIGTTKTSAEAAPLEQQRAQLQAEQRAAEEAAKPEIKPTVTPTKPQPAPTEDQYTQAVREVMDAKDPSTSLLQRKLKIGYGPANALLDRMQQEGLISTPGPKGRTILKQPEATPAAEVPPAEQPATPAVTETSGRLSYGQLQAEQANLLHVYNDPNTSPEQKQALGATLKAITRQMQVHEKAGTVPKAEPVAETVPPAEVKPTEPEVKAPIPETEPEQPEAPKRTAFPTQDEANQIKHGEPMVVTGLTKETSVRQFKKSKVGSDFVTQGERQSDGTYTATIHRVPPGMAKAQFQAELNAQSRKGPKPQEPKTPSAHAATEESMQKLKPGESMTVEMSETDRRQFRRKYTEGKEDPDFTVQKAKGSEAAVITRVDREARAKATQEAAERAARGEETPKPSERPAPPAPEVIAALKPGESHEHETTRKGVEDLDARYRDDPTVKVKGTKVPGDENRWVAKVTKVDPNIKVERPARELKPGYEDPEAHERPAAGWGQIASKAFKETTTDGKTAGALFNDPSIQAALGLEAGANPRDVKNAMAAAIGKRSHTDISPAEYRNWMRDQGWSEASTPWMKFEATLRAAGINAPSTAGEKPAAKAPTSKSPIYREAVESMKPASRQEAQRQADRIDKAAVSSPLDSNLAVANKAAKRIVAIDERTEALMEKLGQDDPAALREVNNLQEERVRAQETVEDHRNALHRAETEMSRAERTQADEETRKAEGEEAVRLKAEIEAGKKELRPLSDERNQVREKLKTATTKKEQETLGARERVLDRSITARSNEIKKRMDRVAEIESKAGQPAEGDYRKGILNALAEEGRIDESDLQNVPDGLTRGEAGDLIDKMRSEGLITTDPESGWLTLTAKGKATIGSARGQDHVAGVTDLMRTQFNERGTAQINDEIVAKKLGISEGEAIRALKKMEADGLLTRKGSEFHITRKLEERMLGMEDTNVQQGKGTSRGAKETEVSKVGPTPKEAARDTGTEVETGEEAAGRTTGKGSKEVPGVEESLPEGVREWDKTEMGKLETRAKNLEQAVAELEAKMDETERPTASQKAQMKGLEKQQAEVEQAILDLKSGKAGTTTEPAKPKETSGPNKPSNELRLSRMKQKGREPKSVEDGYKELSRAIGSKEGFEAHNQIRDHKDLNLTPKEFDTAVDSMVSQMDKKGVHPEVLKELLKASKPPEGSKWGEWLKKETGESLPETTEMVANRSKEDATYDVTPEEALKNPPFKAAQWKAGDDGWAHIPELAEHDVNAVQVSPETGAMLDLTLKSGISDGRVIDFQNGRTKGVEKWLDDVRNRISSTLADHLTELADRKGQIAVVVTDHADPQRMVIAYEHAMRHELAHYWVRDITGNVSPFRGKWLVTRPEIEAMRMAYSEHVGKDINDMTNAELETEMVPYLANREFGVMGLNPAQGESLLRDFFGKMAKDYGVAVFDKLLHQNPFTTRLVGEAISERQGRTEKAGAGASLTSEGRPGVDTQGERGLPEGGRKGDRQSRRELVPEPGDEGRHREATFVDIDGKTRTTRPVSPLMDLFKTDFDTAPYIRQVSRPGATPPGTPPAAPPGGGGGGTPPGAPPGSPAPAPAPGPKGGRSTFFGGAPKNKTTGAREWQQFFNTVQVYNHLANMSFWGRNQLAREQQLDFRTAEEAMMDVLERKFYDNKGAAKHFEPSTRSERKAARKQAKIDAREEVERAKKAGTAAHYGSRPTTSMRTLEVLKKYKPLRKFAIHMEDSLARINEIPDNEVKYYNQILESQMMIKLIHERLKSIPNPTVEDLNAMGRVARLEIRASEEYWSYRQENLVSGALGKLKTVMNLVGLPVQDVGYALTRANRKGKGKLFPTMERFVRTMKSLNRRSESTSKSANYWRRAQVQSLGLGDFMSGLKYYQIPGAVIRQGIEGMFIPAFAQFGVHTVKMKQAQARGDWLQEGIHRRKAERAVARGIIGTSTAATSMMMYALGLIEEEWSDNESVQRVQRDTGHRPYAINVTKLWDLIKHPWSAPTLLANRDKRSRSGDWLLDVQLIQPIGVHLAMGAALMHGILDVKWPEEDPVKAALGWKERKGRAERSFARGAAMPFINAADAALESQFGNRYFEDVTNAITYSSDPKALHAPGRFLQTFVETAGHQVTPILGSSNMLALRNVIDPILREGRSERQSGVKLSEQDDSWLKSIGHTLWTGMPGIGTQARSKMPGTSLGLRESLSAYGKTREVRPGMGDKPWLVRAINELSPIKAYKVTEEPAEHEAIVSGVAPGRVGQREGETRETQANRTKWRGERLLQIMNAKIADPKWKHYTLEKRQDEQRKAIREAGRYAARRAGIPFDEQAIEERSQR